MLSGIASGCGLPADVSDIRAWFVLRWPLPERRRWPGTDYWANLVRVGALANAAICNIYITCDLSVIRPESLLSAKINS